MCFLQVRRNTSPILITVVLTSLLTGCVSQYASKPIADGQLTDSLSKTYSTTSLDDIYKRGNKGKAERNVELNKLLTLSDHNYQIFRNEFYANTATTQLVFDWVTLGLSTAGALTTGGAAPILSGTSAAVQGAQGKLNSRFFLEKTTETLVNGMDKLRATKKELIVKKMANLDIEKYSTEEGVRDVLDYHNAGSLISALVEIAADSGKTKQEAETKLNVTEDALASIRNTTFVEDPSSRLLNKFISPDGMKNNDANLKVIRDWMDNNGLASIPLAFLINGTEFAEKRAKAIKDLKLTDK